MSRVIIFIFVILVCCMLVDGFIDFPDYNEIIKVSGFELNDGISFTHENFYVRELRRRKARLADDENCDCGPLTTFCNVISVENASHQLCKCGIDRYVVDGNCEDCACANAICDSNKGICHCLQGYGRSSAGKDCIKCNCGTKSNVCLFEEGMQVCICDSYLAFNSTCSECICGHNEYCYYKSAIKQCDCTLEKADMKEECKDCDCLEEADACTFTEKTKMCKCLPGYALLNGNCTECKCEANFQCEFIEERKQCSCKEGYVEINETCLECDCGSGHDCTLTGDGKKCICRENHILHNGTCHECSCREGEICELINEELSCICADNHIPVNGACIECYCGNGHACEMVNNQKVCICEENYAENNGICQECHCGEDHECEFWSGEKFCKCLPGYANKNGSCERCYCGESSSCFFENDDKVCICRSGFAQIEGKCQGTCKENSDCSNGGSCKQHGSSFFCSCKPGISGDFCGDIDECQAKYKNCRKNFGNCKYDIKLEEAYCECSQQQVYDAAVHLCKECFCGDGHSCVFRNGQKTCVCADNYTEIHNTCHEICQEITCHRGKCTVSGNATFCICESGFTGLICDQKVTLTSGALYMISVFSIITLFWVVFIAVCIIRRKRRYKSAFSKIEDDGSVNASFPYERETGI